ncbi:MFS transporter [Streptomyces platensis]|uniref:MFS transporter n=1 Tax=Streptomyces platensis TaxID=58346 RepID=UPI0038700532|nr:MFS transporter [Streptomyces platensis]
MAGAAGWSVVCRLPVYLMSLALVLVVREQGGSYAQAGLVSALYAVGMAVGGPFIARRMDRTNPRNALLLTGLVYPSALTALVWWTEPATPGQLVLALTAGVALPPGNACMRSLWARIPLAEDERETAYLWEALLAELLITSAPLIFAVLMVTGSARTALTTVAVVGGVGAVGLGTTRLLRTRTAGDGATPPDAAEDGTPADSAARGVLGPISNTGMPALLLVMAAASVPVGLMTLAIPAFVDEQGSPGHTGVVYACWGIGSAIGALLLGRSQSERPVHRRFPWLLLAYAGGTALPLLATSEVALALTLAVGSAPIALVSASEMSLVSRLADSDKAAEAFTWASLATVIGDALGQQIGGLLVEPLAARGVFAVAAIVSLAASAGAFAFRGLFAGEPRPAPAPA